ncbi:MAG: DUF507 family protein [Nitrospiraceae bacterium]|nr:MAG: DUF507 family protein [Nitrospiraceae bacterium]
MRVPKGWVPVLAKEILEDILKRNQVDLLKSREEVASDLEEIILEELMVEDRLNAEVREILKKFESEIEKGRMDYRRLFDMTKQKLVKERSIVL